MPGHVYRLTTYEIVKTSQPTKCQVPHQVFRLLQNMLKIKFKL